MAVALPLLLAGSLSPSSTFFNQVTATLGWSVLLIFAAPLAGGSGWSARSVGALQAWLGSLGWLWLALVVLMLGIAVSSTPWGQRLAPLACVGLALAVSGALAGGSGGASGPQVLAALLLAGLLSGAVGWVQVFVPEAANGWLIAHPTAEGLAIGNIRQPNQLSTLLLWACAAAVWWALERGWRWGVLAGVLAVLVFTVVLTASRTGVVGVGMLALWGLLDRKLPGKARVLLVAAPVFYALTWWGMNTWAHAVGHAFHGGERMTATMHGYGSDSRLTTWRNTLDLIAMQPWTGVGFGAYNFAWTFTAFPGRSTAFFDHSHNLLLQLAVELGLPLASLIVALLLASLASARAGLVAADLRVARSARTALFMLAVVGVHSLLEYPLWYAYFLLPTAALWGWYCGLARKAAAQASEPAAPAPGPGHRPEGAATPAAPVVAQAVAGPWAWGLALAGALSLAGSAYALFDFWRVATIFETKIPGAQVPLSLRIERGREGWLFGQHAEYARVTMAEQPEQVIAHFERPLFHLIDTRLMIAYAKALAGRGELAKARQVAARLREFNKPDAEEFFAECGPRPEAFQCGPDPRLPYQALWPATLAPPWGAASARSASSAR